MHLDQANTAPPQRLFALVSRVLGALLLLAAGLKIYGFGVDPVARMGVFSTPAFQFLVIAFEVFLGAWLLSGRFAAGAWLAALATFLIFAAVSGYQGAMGHASCGCMGNKVSVNPWLMFTLDLSAIAALSIARPDLRPLWEQPRKNFGAAFSVVGGLAALALLFFAAVHAGFGSLPAAIAYFRGERVSIYPRLADLGQGEPGETREADVEVANWTEQPIRVFGGTSDCSCTVLGDLPVTVPPGESRSVSVQVSLGERPGIFTRKAAFLVDDEGHRAVSFRLTGRVIARTQTE